MNESKVAYLLGAREHARALGDAGQARAITADLARLGHYDERGPDLETVVPDPGPVEHAVPVKKRRGRPPKIRTVEEEHERHQGGSEEPAEELGGGFQEH